MTIPFKGRKFLRLLATLIVAVTTPALAQTTDEELYKEFSKEYPDWRALSGDSQKVKRPLTLEQVNKVAKTLGWSNPNLKGIFGAMQAASNEKAIQCMKATGNEHLCRCLADKLPLVVSFRWYVRIITGEKNLYFPELTAEEIKKLIDLTIGTRDLCITGLR